MPRTDTRYIFAVAGKTYIGQWGHRGFRVQPDERAPDEVMTAALDKGWEGRYAGAGFGTKTTEVICKRYGYDWEAHGVVAKYEAVE